MPRQSEIDRMIVLLYLSNNAHDFTNYRRPADWLDKLPMAGLEELRSMLTRMASEVTDEMTQREADGMPKYPREWYESQEAERKAGAALLASIGVNSEED